MASESWRINLQALHVKVGHCGFSFPGSGFHSSRAAKTLIPRTRPQNPKHYTLKFKTTADVLKLPLRDVSTHRLEPDKNLSYLGRYTAFLYDYNNPKPFV